MGYALYHLCSTIAGLLKGQRHRDYSVRVTLPSQLRVMEEGACVSKLFILGCLNVRGIKTYELHLLGLIHTNFNYLASSPHSQEDSLSCTPRIIRGRKSLHNQIKKLTDFSSDRSESWKIASLNPLTLCQLRIQHKSSQARADVSLSFSITRQLQWSLMVTDQLVNLASCPFLSVVQPTLNSTSAGFSLLRVLNATKICLGNPDKKFLDHWRQRSLTLHGNSG